MANYPWKCFETVTSLIELNNYNGETDIVLRCTQLHEGIYPKESDRKRVLREWCDFLRHNPKALKRLHITTRINQELFNAVCCQTELEELIIRWGLYPDLSPIIQLQNLKSLELGGSPSHKEISPIAELCSLDNLRLDNFVGITDYSAIGKLTELKTLALQSSMHGIIKVENLDFLNFTPHLKQFWTTGFRLLNHDYSPILELKELEWLSVNMPSCDWRKWNPILSERFNQIMYK